jgi:hypothetical protein
MHNEMFPIYGGKCLSLKTIHNWIAKFSQGRSKIADDETGVREWLREQSNDFYAAGFDALVKRWDKCICVGGGYMEKYFFQVRESHVLRFISIYGLFTHSPSYVKLYTLCYHFLKEARGSIEAVERKVN